ncbi:acyl-CoA synthetase [Saccharopolyspora spinosa]|uniref:acyl-CoA synthetase n=1 Tax=Saccharopolyspora spinosa TaxID=60894 RepID=UPI00023797AC|nr:acyl-CoA synthetase [Saccharopolyspora spinosa]
MYRQDQLRALEEFGPVLVQYHGVGEVTGNITVLPPDRHDRQLPDALDFGSWEQDRFPSRSGDSWRSARSRHPASTARSWRSCAA